MRDPEILEETAEHIDAGDSAAFAWVRTLDDYIAELEEADDEHAAGARRRHHRHQEPRPRGAGRNGRSTDFPAGSIFVGKDMEPSRFLCT